MNFNRDQTIFCARLIQELYDGHIHPNVVSPATDTEALVYHGENGGATYVIFPGTSSAEDWRTDFKFRKSAWQIGPGNVFAGRVHRGFNAAILSVIDQIITLLPAEARVVIAGHSLGGALAMLCAHQLTSRIAAPGKVAAVYTFGQPRVGNWTFSLYYNAALHDETFRIVNAGDPVTVVPPVLFGYKHAGTEVYLRRGGGATFGHPWWTSCVEAGQKLREMSDTSDPDDAARAQLFAIPHHGIKHYIAKLEALA